jgi:hypothetical protein
MNITLPKKLLSEMNRERFDYLKDKINKLAADYSPSKSNGRVPVFLEVVKQMFISERVNEEAYWQYVSEMRGKTPEKKVSTGNTTIPGIIETSF